MKNILVLCTGNSCRSQMAEGYLRFFAKGKANIYSAGIEAHGVNPKAIQVMTEDGIDISTHISKTIDEILNYPPFRRGVRGGAFDYIITVCDNAKENCPYFPSRAKKFHHNFPDPFKAKGSEEDILQLYREVRDMIKEYAEEFIEGTFRTKNPIIKKDTTVTNKSKEEWKKQLTPEQYVITCEGGTEPAFSGKYLNNHDKGMYKCVRCGNMLFDSDAKYDSGSGWPSFYKFEKDSSIATRTDHSYGIKRTEVVCNKCGAHLGHLFDDGPKPTGLRYCINSGSLNFQEKK